MPLASSRGAGEKGRRASGKMSPSPALPFSLFPLQILSYSGFAEKIRRLIKAGAEYGIERLI